MDIRLMLSTAIFCALIATSSAKAAGAPGVEVIDEQVTPCSVPCDHTMVIFVHGLTGDRTTWLNESSQKYFQDLLREDPALAPLDIYTVTYPSGLLTGPSVMAILESVEEKLDQKILARGYTRIIIIAHSLGGNIARGYLGHLVNRWGHAALGRVRLLFTLATPVRGADDAVVAARVSWNEQVRALRPINTNDFLQLLNHSTREFSRKHVDHGCPSLRVHAAYEMDGMANVRIVVSQESAIEDSDSNMGFHRTHKSIAKPENRTDEVYRWIAGDIKQCVQNGTVCPIRAREGICSGDLH